MEDRMKKINLIIRAAWAVVISTALLLTGCSSQSKESNHLRVGMSADFAPYAYIDGGKIVGFDVDFIKAIAAKLDMRVSFQDLPFETLIPQLATGKVDLVAGGMSPTPERDQRVLFSKTYIQGEPIVALSRANSDFSKTADYTQARIVVCMGYSSSDDYVTNVLHLDPIRLTNLADCLLAIKSRQADLLVGPKMSIMPIITKELSDWHVHVFEGTAESIALLISKLSPELKEKVDAAIEELITEGEIQKLKDRWNIP